MAAQAKPWIRPGDLGLRNDIQLLADKGVIKAPVMAWPLSWGGVARDVLEVDRDLVLAPHELAALERIRDRARRETQGEFDRHVRASVGEGARIVRTFEDTPREDAELQGGIGWTGNRFAMNLRVTAVGDPADGKGVRLDGSYLGASVGNWMFSVDVMDRWWGPGHEGSLILSNNARPIPAFSIQRNYSEPVDIKWLRWVGPWTAQVIFGRLESDRAIPDARFFGLRFGFRPLRQLEIGLSRSAQWCGDGRPCDFDTFIDLLTGLQDNIEDPNARENEPGNQLAGYDLRWTPNIFGRRAAIYAQLIGEDEAGGLPSEFLGLVGVETWGTWERLNTSYRVHAEYADARCGGISDSMPSLRCAYNHSIYQTGYRYRGRVIGHAAEGDGQMFSVGSLFVSEGGRSWNALVRRILINPSSDPRNTITSTEQELINVEVSHSREIVLGHIDVGAGYDRTEDKMAGTTNDEIRAFLRWRWNP